MQSPSTFRIRDLICKRLSGQVLRFLKLRYESKIPFSLSDPFGTVRTHLCFSARGNLVLPIPWRPSSPFLAHLHTQIAQVSPEGTYAGFGGHFPLPIFHRLSSQSELDLTYTRLFSDSQSESNLLVVRGLLPSCFFYQPQ